MMLYIGRRELFTLDWVGRLSNDEAFCTKIIIGPFSLDYCHRIGRLEWLVVGDATCGAHEWSDGGLYR